MIYNPKNKTCFHFVPTNFKIINVTSNKNSQNDITEFLICYKLWILFTQPFLVESNHLSSVRSEQTTQKLCNISI